MEAHFLRVMNGRASPASERERAWLAYYQKLINDGVLIDPEEKLKRDTSPMVPEEEPAGWLVLRGRRGTIGRLIRPPAGTNGGMPWGRTKLYLKNTLDEFSRLPAAPSPPAGWRRTLYRL